MSRDTIVTGLTALQADGLACVTCGTDYLTVSTPHVPVGRSVTGSQVFPCVGCCPDDVHARREVRCGERHDDPARRDRALWVQCACTALVALGAAYASYRHGREFALRFGADEATAAIWPLIVDGLLTTATVELWKTGHGRRAGAGGRRGWRSCSGFACRYAPTWRRHLS